MPQNYASGVFDIPALAKLTWELYNQCHSLSKDAPGGFQTLMNALGSLQGNLRMLSEDVSSNTSFSDEMDMSRKQTLGKCLNGCHQTLWRLNTLLDLYRDMGIKQGTEFWQKINWTTQRAQIEDIRSKLVIHTCNLSICRSSIGDASLARLEQTIAKTMEEDKQAMAALESSSKCDPPIPILHRSIRGSLSDQPNSSSDDNKCQSDHLKVAPLRQAKHGSGRRRQSSISSESVVSGSDGSFYGGTSATSPTSFNAARSPSQSMTGRIHHSQGRSEQVYEENVGDRTYEKTFWEDNSDMQDKQSLTERSSDGSQVNYEHHGVLDPISSAMKQLHQVRLKEQSARPVRYEPLNPAHLSNKEVLRLFETSINEELQVRRLETRDWLRVATWWLLKARVTLANCSRHNYVSARGSLSPSIDSSFISHQAYIDLLKTAYILYKVVLKDESSPSILTDENRKSIAELSESIQYELSQFSTLDIPDTENTLSQNCAIWEPLQPEETPDSCVEFSLGLDNARWISVDQEDAGAEDEKVLYRTFVNAGIGGKKLRMRTKGAPYMLLLATQEGESEPKIILCNQSGSLYLQRNFLPDDLPPMIQLANATMAGYPGARVSEPLPFKFGSMSATISFQFDIDLGQFINIPKAYFDAVWLREPVDSKDFTETVIFKESIEKLEQLKPPTMKPLNPPAIIKSCEIRILERAFDEAWRSTRRVVISPSVARPAPRCIELFMPLGGVQVNREDRSRQVLLKWSDACQERSDKTDGNYNTLYSYIYDETAPNIGYSIHFRSQQSALDFEKAVLELSFRSTFAWSEQSGSGRIYDVIDAGTEHKQYKAVVISEKHSTWRYNSVYYIYRNTDYAYESSSLSIRFPTISHTDYVSTHVDQLYRADEPVGFSHCQKKSKNLTIRFDNEPISRSFLNALSPLYELTFSRRIQSLSTKGKSLFGSKKSSKGGAEVQLWRRGTNFQLAARWDDNIPDKWLTISLPSDSLESPKESARVSFPRLPYNRGSVLDMANILARNPKATNAGAREGSVSVLFQTSGDREQFLSALRGMPF